MDFRKTYDSIPEQFDKWRPRYCKELFDTVIAEARINKSADVSSVLEIGPGSGQATEPFLMTGCDYTAIELGENFVSFDKKKFASYDNFNIINGDFETYDFGSRKFDLIFSAATIQWIPERVGFPKIFKLLKDGGMLAMFMTRTDDKSANVELYDELQRVFDEQFYVDASYHCKLTYENALNYGFTDLVYRDWHETKTYTADEYVEYLASTQIGHITLREPYKSAYFNGVREAILRHGNKMILNNTIALYTVRKPQIATSL